MPTSSSDRRHFIILGVLVVIFTIILDWLLQVGLPLPIQASIEALTIDRLIGWHLTLIAFLFALVIVPMIYIFVIFRQREGDTSDGEHFEGNVILEVAWTVIPLLLVIFFGWVGVRDLWEVTKTGEELSVKANGFQWDWSFEYEGGVLTEELLLPVNRRVRMDLNSDNVLHSFWVPEFRVKQDLVPGYPQDLYFTPTKVGEYSVNCAELCGRSHYQMTAVVRVVEQDEFTAWLATEQAKVNDGKVVADAATDDASQ
jgi:cytochrome c oxidase subunit II